MIACVLMAAFLVMQPATPPEAVVPVAPVMQPAVPAKVPADATPPPRTTTVVVGDYSSANPPSAEVLLDWIEASDAKLKSLSADILYDRVFEIQGDRQIRRGQLFFEDRGLGEGGKPRRVIGAKFASLQVGDRFTPEEYHIVFDGVFLVERWPGSKQFVKTQVARPGEAVDALRAGKGPLPLPIGQKKADILARYTAEVLNSDEGATANVASETPNIVAFVKDCVQLKLTVRPELAGTEELHEIRLWYRIDGGMVLPRLVRAVNRAEDVSLVQLVNVKANETTPEGALDMVTPKDGWDVQVRELPAPAAKGP